jgi:hypothetical protein
MIVDRIRVEAAMTLPTVHFGNVRPSVELGATLDPGEDVATAARALQDTANGLLAQHVHSLVQLQQELKA